MSPRSLRPRRDVLGPALGLLVGLVAIPLVTYPPAHAESVDAPQVGQCFDLTDDQLTGTWIDARAVDCSEGHTVVVTSVHSLAADDDPVSAIGRECGPLGVWNEIGVNRPVAGIITDPLRVEPRGFAVRTPEPTVACGAAVVAWPADGESRVQVMDRDLDSLTPRARASLRYCIDPRVRRPAGPGPTVACTEVPRWQVRSWVVWTAFFDDYPGRSVLREQARRLCGASARFSLPARAEWSQGLPRTWCTTRVPL